MPPRNPSFDAAVEKLRELGGQSGSPIGAAAASVTAGVDLSGTFTDAPQPGFAEGGTNNAKAAGTDFTVSFGGILASLAAAQIERHAAEQVKAEAADLFGDAQTMTVMSASARAYADRLFMQGKFEAASHVRDAARSMHRASKVSRLGAEEILEQAA